MKVIQLKTALKDKGYKVKDLYEKVSFKYLVSYPTIANYCRCTTKRTWKDKRLQGLIEQALKEMKVEWS